MDERKAAALAWSIAQAADEIRAGLDAGHVEDSIRALYVLATGDPAWGEATTVAERARIIYRVMTSNDSIRAALEEDLDSGRLFTGLGDSGSSGGFLDTEDVTYSIDGARFRISEGDEAPAERIHLDMGPEPRSVEVGSGADPDAVSDWLRRMEVRPGANQTSPEDEDVDGIPLRLGILRGRRQADSPSSPEEDGRSELQLPELVEPDVDERRPTTGALSTVADAGASAPSDPDKSVVSDGVFESVSAPSIEPTVYPVAPSEYLDLPSTIAPAPTPPPTAPLSRKGWGFGIRLPRWRRRSTETSWSGIRGPSPIESVPPSGPAEPSPGEVVQTWLNAEMPHADTTRPLAMHEEYTLALSFGSRLQGALESVSTSLTFPPPSVPGSEHLDLTIQLLSDDFRVPPLPQTLRVLRDGTSVGRCLFEITPIKSGLAVVRARVEFEGNWVQQLDLRFDVSPDGATDGTPAADVQSLTYGRPLNPGVPYRPRAASMTFTPDDGGYKLFVRGVTDTEVFVRLTPNELDAAIDKVRSTLLAIVSDPGFAHNVDVPTELRQAALEKLAFAGFLLYARIFRSPYSSPALREVGRWLRELPDDIPILQIVSNGFPVPWALLYPADKFDESRLDWSNFVGMRHVIEQIPMRDDIAVPPPPATIESAPALTVRVLYNDGIDETMPSHPVAAQRDYWKACRGVDLAEGTTADDLIHTALAPGSADKVLYFYCHAVGSKKNPDDSRLELSGGQKVTLGSLWAYAPVDEHLEGHPLVFINACESGHLSPLFYNDFVPYFLGKGARGVIGTEAKIPGLFASEWAKAFFSRFFTGEKLGDVVLSLRREFLTEHGNPLGLLYGVHCDTDTRIDPALYSNSTPGS